MTGSAAALLHVALQDLHAGKTAQAARLPTLAGHGRDPALVDLVREEAVRAAAQGRRIAHAGVDVAGPECLWMKGILDDARRDTRRT